jgi:hypothetical protein
MADVRNEVEHLAPREPVTAVRCGVFVSTSV